MIRQVSQIYFVRTYDQLVYLEGQMWQVLHSVFL